LAKELENALQGGVGTESDKETKPRVIGRERVAEEAGDWVWSNEMDDWVWAADGYEWIWSIENDEWELVPSSATKAASLASGGQPDAANTQESNWQEQAEQGLEQVKWVEEQKVDEINQVEEKQDWNTEQKQEAWNVEGVVDQSNWQETKVNEDVNERAWTTDQDQQDWEQWQAGDDVAQAEQKQETGGGWNENALQPPALDNTEWTNQEWQGVGDTTLPTSDEDNFATTYSAQQYPPSPSIHRATTILDNSGAYAYGGAVHGVAIENRSGSFDDGAGDGSESDGGTDEEVDEQSGWVEEPKYNQSVLIPPPLVSPLRSPHDPRRSGWGP
jgi:hypothetical protein